MGGEEGRAQTGGRKQGVAAVARQDAQAPPCRASAAELELPLGQYEQPRRAGGEAEDALGREEETPVCQLMRQLPVAGHAA